MQSKTHQKKFLVFLYLLISNCIILPNLAFAVPPNINPEFIKRDTLLIITAILTLVLFYVLKGQNKKSRSINFGRRAEDMKNILDSLVSKPQEDSIDVWEPVGIDSIEIQLEHEIPIWNIGLFTTDLLFNPNTDYNNSDEDFYSLANNVQTLDGIVAPIVRKIIIKYRTEFDKNKPILINKLEGSNNSPILTWLANNLEIRNTIIDYLDECVKISKNYRVHPNLEITTGNCFIIKVSFPYISDLIKKFDSLKAKKGLEITIKDYEIDLELWVAFESSKIPGHFESKKSELQSA